MGRWNLGASTPEEYGNLYYWGDSTGTASSGPTSINIYDFDDICGSEYDIARTQLGKYWRMPQKNSWNLEISAR